MNYSVKYARTLRYDSGREVTGQSCRNISAASPDEAAQKLQYQLKREYGSWLAWVGILSIT